MKNVSFLLLLAGAFALERQCEPGFVVVPTTFESFECLNREKLQQLKDIEAFKRFDAVSGTRFYLWTQETTAGQHEELTFNDLGSLNNSSFNPGNPTRILIHGWLSDWTAEAVDGLAKAYVNKGAYNVIGVDWSEGASAPNYVTARMRVDPVADTLADQISVLLRAGQQPSQIVIIGHSLGAHIAGLTGKHFQAQPKLAAVIALDPAGPLFSESDPSDRVDRNDAEYVEIIHTNKGLLGHDAKLGHADFFPNGGRSQAGCLTVTCNPHRAVEYLRKSLESPEALYVGRRCETESVDENCLGSPAVMGSDINDEYKITTPGAFYLQIDD